MFSSSHLVLVHWNPLLSVSGRVSRTMASDLYLTLLYPQSGSHPVQLKINPLPWH